MAEGTLFDYIVLIYLVWGWIRGSWRGLYRELFGSLIALLLLAMLAGYSLISSVWHLISHLNQHSLHLSGVLGYSLLLLGTLLLLWRIRWRLQQLKTGKPVATGIPSGIVGTLRTALWSMAFIAINRLLPLNLFEKLFIDQSITLALLEPILTFFHVV